MKTQIISVLAFVCLCCSGCGASGRSGDNGGDSGLHDFPVISVPGVYNTSEERLEYSILHYWDKFFQIGGKTDSSAILGVSSGIVEQAMADYIRMLDFAPVTTAQKGVENLFRKMEAKQAADSASIQYLLLSELVCKYLYNPDSPLRNEDYFLPFVRGLAASPYTQKNLRSGYEFQARMCALNQFGQQVSDFKFKDIRGGIHSLYGLKAEYTMLFFSNPGCHSCKEIIEQVCSWPYTDEWIASGKLAVANVYIDRELQTWKEYEHNYPRNWVTGYDYNFILREDLSYNIRAIPYLFLLDREKRVIMKDAPTQKVLGYLNAIATNQQ